MSSAEQALAAPGRPDVVAAGCVVLRKGSRGHEVLLVHRPRYDDWSFPKGKVERGETLADCAVREVQEETGVRVTLGLPLATQRYRIANGRPKTVHYWVAREAASGSVAFTPDDEVDEIRWVTWEEALDQLTYFYDVDTLTQARQQRRPTRQVVLVRRAGAERALDELAGHRGSMTTLVPETLEEARAALAGALAGDAAQTSSSLAVVVRGRWVDDLVDPLEPCQSLARGGIAPGGWLALHQRDGELLVVERPAVPRPGASSSG